MELFMMFSKDFIEIIVSFISMNGKDIMAWGIRCQKHYRIIHDNNEFVNKRSHIYILKRFWKYARYRLQKFKGIKSKYFDFSLK